MNVLFMNEFNLIILIKFKANVIKSRTLTGRCFTESALREKRVDSGQESLGGAATAARGKQPIHLAIWSLGHIHFAI